MKYYVIRRYDVGTYSADKCSELHISNSKPKLVHNLQEKTKTDNTQPVTEEHSSSYMFQWQHI